MLYVLLLLAYLGYVSGGAPVVDIAPLETAPPVAALPPVEIPQAALPELAVEREAPRDAPPLPKQLEKLPGRTPAGSD